MATGDDSVRKPNPTAPKPCARSTSISASVQPRSGPTASTTRPRPQRLASSRVVPTAQSPVACAAVPRSPPVLERRYQLTQKRVRVALQVCGPLTTCTAAFRHGLYCMYRLAAPCSIFNDSASISVKLAFSSSSHACAEPP